MHAEKKANPAPGVLHEHDRHNHRKWRKMIRRFRNGTVNHNCGWYQRLVKRGDAKP